MASITPRGDQFLAQVRLKRAGTIIFSESKIFPTRQLAEGWSRRLEAELKLKGVATVAHGKITVGELIRKHLKYMQGLRHLGRSAIHNSEFTAAGFDSVKLSDLDAGQVVRYAARRRADGAGPATILANLSALSAAVHAAPYALGIQVDPAPVEQALAKLKESGLAARSRHVMRRIERDEEQALLEELGRATQHHQSIMDMVSVFRLAIAFPRRASELTRIRWADIDQKKRTVIVRDVKDPRRKQGNDQVVPLLGEAWDIVQALPRQDACILPYNTESMLSAFERARNRIAATGMPKIKEIRFHDLRHEGISRLFEKGLAIQEVAIVSGHTNWAQLRRYSHLRPESLHRHFKQPTTT